MTWPRMPAPDADDLLPHGTEPDAGTAGLASFREDGVEILALDAAAADGRRHARDARRRSSTMTPPRRWSPDAGSLPEDDKLAQLTRAGWTHGVVLRVPAGVRLERADRHPLGRRCARIEP